ncbi:ABC transporter ATP-binding protein [Allobaculum sp. JKK-2023]|uniref:ABC transporter ATP-binding protein n=1 Tax=Allobaculum sp. JKK-2023 TaxID=3108943 RepID=UPI002B05B501|nr:ABC transporter ATP-binding protein [Allobaculum sp. JKK-2023]
MTTKADQPKNKAVSQSRRKTFGKLLSYMGNHKFEFLFVGILVTISGLANLIGTYMIRPVVNAADARQMHTLSVLLIVTAVIYVCGVLSAWGYTQIMARGAQQVTREIRHDLFEKMEGLPLQIFDTTKFGDLMARFTSDVDTVSDALNNSFASVIQNFIQAAGTLVVLFILNWQLTLIVAAFYLMMIAYVLIASKISRRYFRDQQHFIGALNGFVEEAISGLRVIKVFNHEKASMKEFEAYDERLEHASERALSYSQTMVPVIVSFSYTNYAIVAVVGGYMVLNGLSDVGSLASYLVFVRQAAAPINQFVQQATMLLSALSGAERIFSFMENPDETDEGKVTLAYGVKDPETGKWTESSIPADGWVWKHPRSDGTCEYVPLEGDVRFEDVNFSYVPDKQILYDLNLYAKPGQTIALVGSTGAGKTTITNLLNRFYELDSGSILYDGIDIKLISKDDLRRSLAMVLQDTHLFAGTIIDNIRYGNLNASDEECIAAAKLANADSFIRRLPEGYQTQISSDGASLSQGQRQLLSIARAAVANPPVLVLDEATSSIDTRTEKLIESGMKKLMNDRTTFVIAHRLSTVRNADCIIVLDQGRIVERGSHDELLKKNGFYAQLYNGMFELS